jgi:hypothetical protein
MLTLLPPPVDIIAEQESATPVEVESHSTEEVDRCRRTRKMSPNPGTRNAYGKIQRIPFFYDNRRCLIV